MTHEPAALGGFHDRRMEPLTELLVGELREGAREGAFARQLRGSGPTAEAAQLCVLLEATDQMARVG